MEGLERGASTAARRSQSSSGCLTCGFLKSVRLAPRQQIAVDSADLAEEYGSYPVGMGGLKGLQSREEAT